MPKDRSYAQRIHQSNIDRQRNAAFFLNRTAPNAGVLEAPTLWQRIKTFAKKLWAKVKEIVND